MWARYGAQVQFYVVYIREAHPLDGDSPLGGGGMPIVEDPKDLEERREVARVCLTKLALEPMPALVDDLDDTANQAFAAWPDRLYLIGRDGRVAYRGDEGPMGFLPDRLEEAIRRELGLGGSREPAEPEKPSEPAKPGPG